MQDAHIWFALAAMFVLSVGWSLVTVLRQRSLERIEERKMLHAERMAALEKGIDPILESPESALQVPPPPVRLPAIFAGLTLSLGGLGYSLGMLLVPVTKETLGMRELASLGLIPMSIGFGCLLFVWLLRERRV